MDYSSDSTPGSGSARFTSAVGLFDVLEKADAESVAFVPALDESGMSWEQRNPRHSNDTNVRATIHAAPKEKPLVDR